MLNASARAEDIHEYCAKRGMVADGEEGSSEWGCKPAPGGSDGDYDYAAAERQRLENERKKREVRERLLREDELAEKDQRRRSGEVPLAEGLKGLDAAGGKARGGSAARGARGVLRDNRNPLGLKGLDDEPPAGASCRIVDSCMGALKGQEKALEAARLDQRDLYWAAGSAELQHGLDLAKEAFASGPRAADEAPLRVWKSGDKAGFDQFMQDYKARVDESTGLFGSAAYGSMTAGEFKGKVDGLKEKGAKVREYSRYVDEVLKCADVLDKEFNACVEKAGALHDQALEDLPLGGLTKKRLQLARDALRKYASRALDRAMSLASAASRCAKGCE